MLICQLFSLLDITDTSKGFEFAMFCNGMGMRLWQVVGCETILHFEDLPYPIYRRTGHLIMLNCFLLGSILLQLLK